MKILLITQYFYPENFKSNDIAFELVKRGHEVDALVGIPNYPEGKIYSGYGLFKKRRESIKGVNVYRSFQIPRGTGGGLKLMINYLSFVLSSCFNVLFYFAWRNYDAIIVHEVSPIFQAYPAILLRKLRKVPVYLWVLDIWPDAMMSGGGPIVFNHLKLRCGNNANRSRKNVGTSKVLPIGTRISIICNMFITTNTTAPAYFI